MGATARISCSRAPPQSRPHRLRNLPRGLLTNNLWYLGVGTLRHWKWLVPGRTPWTGRSLAAPAVLSSLIQTSLAPGGIRTSLVAQGCRQQLELSAPDNSEAASPGILWPVLLQSKWEELCAAVPSKSHCQSRLFYLEDFLKDCFLRPCSRLFESNSILVGPRN